MARGNGVLRGANVHIAGYSVHRRGRRREGTYAIQVGLWHCSTLWELAMAHDPLLHAHATAPESPVPANAALDLLRIKTELVVGGGTGVGGG